MSWQHDINKSFYENYLKYGECTTYGRTKKQIELSVKNFPKKIIFCDNYPVRVISFLWIEAQYIYTEHMMML